MSCRDGYRSVGGWCYPMAGGVPYEDTDVSHGVDSTVYTTQEQFDNLFIDNNKLNNNGILAIVAIIAVFSLMGKR